MTFNTLHSTLCYSNLNATKDPYEFCGKKQLGSFYFVPAMGQLSAGITLLTCGPFMNLSVFSDTNQIRDPQMFVEIFEKKVEEMIAGSSKKSS